MGMRIPEYQCKIIGKPKTLPLKSKTVTVEYQVHQIEGFTRNEDGVDVPNGIEFSFLSPVRVIHEDK